MSSFTRKLRFEQCEDRRMLAVFTVSNTNDGVVDGPGDQPGTLRQAIFDADFAPGPDTINFSTVPADGLDGGTITLTQGELSITDSVIIDASMLSSLTVDATGNDPTPTIDNGDGTRIFNILNNFNTVTINNLTLTGGDVVGNGGAIFSNASLTLTDVDIIDNYATGSGGGLYAVYAVAA